VLDKTELINFYRNSSSHAREVQIFLILANRGSRNEL